MAPRDSQGDYLEAIYSIRELRGSCRSIDVAGYLGYSKPSVSVACRKLRENGLLEPKAPRGELYLTRRGRELGKGIADRHRFFREWLISLGVDKEQASSDSCGLERMVSASTFDRLKAHIDSQKT